MVAYSVTVGRIPTEEFIDGVTEVRYIPNVNLDAAEKNIGNKPGVTRTTQSGTSFGVTQTTLNLYENKDFVNTVVDVRGTGVIRFRNCRITLGNGYTLVDSIGAVVRVLNGSGVTEVIFEDCEIHNRCQRAFSGMSGRNITLIRTVITGGADLFRDVPAGTGSMGATYGYKAYDSWFGDFAWWRTPVVNSEIHPSSLQVHADGGQIGSTLGSELHNCTFAMYVSEFVGTGTPGSGSDAGNPYSANYIVDQATMESWRATHCSTFTDPALSPDGLSHRLPNGNEGCSVAAVMINRSPVVIDGGHSYGSFIPINASDTNLPNPVTNVTVEAMTFHNDMRNPTGRGSSKGHAIGTRTGRTYNIPTTGSRRNLWQDGTTVTPTNIV